MHEGESGSTDRANKTVFAGGPRFAQPNMTARQQQFVTKMGIQFPPVNAHSPRDMTKHRLSGAPLESSVRINPTYKNKIASPSTHRAYEGREQDCLDALKERFNELAYSQDIHRLYMEAIAAGWPLLEIISAVNVLVLMSAGAHQERYNHAASRR